MKMRNIKESLICHRCEKPPFPSQFPKERMWKWFNSEMAPNLQWAKTIHNAEFPNIRNSHSNKNMKMRNLKEPYICHGCEKPPFACIGTSQFLGERMWKWYNSEMAPTLTAIRSPSLLLVHFLWSERMTGERMRNLRIFDVISFHNTSLKKNNTSF